MGVKVTLTLDVDRKALDLLTPQMRSQLGKAVAKMARDIEGQAKMTAPVDTGFLKGSILARPIGPLLWEVNVGAHYGAFVELGTRFMGARPYLQPAVERMRPVLAEVVRQALEKATKEAGGE